MKSTTGVNSTKALSLPLTLNKSKLERLPMVCFSFVSKARDIIHYTSFSLKLTNVLTMLECYVALDRKGFGTDKHLQGYWVCSLVSKKMKC
jgi:hypothetical protein